MKQAKISVLLLLLVALTPLVLADLPTLPSEYWGLINNGAVEHGLGVLAWIDLNDNNVLDLSGANTFDGDEIFQDTSTISSGGNVYYNIMVPADDSETPEIEGGVPGDFVIIRINGVDASPLLEWISGSNDYVDIFVNLNPPVINEFSPLADPVINETESQLFYVVASDIEGNNLSYSWFLNTVLVSNAENYTFVSDLESAGFYNVTVIVNDGLYSVDNYWNLTVMDINNAPIFELIGDKVVNENKTLEFFVNASDSDGDELTYSFKNLPSGATFTNQIFTWIPGFDQAGTYMVEFIVSDGSLTDFETVNITVINVNRAPFLENLSNKMDVEGEIITLNPVVWDPDNNQLNVLVNDSRFVEQDNYVFTWQTSEGDTGIYSITVIVSDAEFEISETVIVTVLDIFELELKSGFNLVSMPFVNVIGDADNNPVFNDSIIPLTQPIENNLDTVFYYEDENWYSYSPDKPLFLNSLHTFKESMGVWFKMDSADTLVIAGLFRYPVQFNMSNGWNMIGYPSAEAAEPQEVFGDVYGTYKTIFAYNASSDEWQSYNPDKPEFLNSLHTIIPGHGYWVMATEDTIWEFDGTGFSTG